jgi:hypothetical protein
MRLVATGGIIGIAVLLGAVLVGQDVAGWIVGRSRPPIRAAAIRLATWTRRLLLPIKLRPAARPGPRSVRRISGGAG